MGRTIRQDFKDLRVSQIENDLVRPLLEVASEVKRIGDSEFKKRAANDQDMATSKKAKAEAVGNVEGTLAFLSRMASIQGGSESEEVAFRNMATGAFALSQRVAAAGLREAQTNLLEARRDD